MRISALFPTLRQNILSLTIVPLVPAVVVAAMSVALFPTGPDLIQVEGKYLSLTKYAKPSLVIVTDSYCVISVVVN